MKSNYFLKTIMKIAVSAAMAAVVFAVLTVTASAKTDKNERAVIDYTNTPASGTVSIKLARSAAPLTAKVSIEKGEMRYNYNLRNDGGTESFPLQMGNGEYTVRVLLSVPDNSNRFSLALGSTYKLDLKDKNAVFLNSSQFVNFNKDSKTAAKAAELIKEAGAKTDIQKAEAIYAFVVEEFSYDSDKAKKVISGELSSYVPALDEILSARKGICFDYATLFAAMLRSQNIPAKLVMGDVANPDPKAPAGSKVYHAWNEFFSKESGKWIRINEMRFDADRFERVDPTFDSTSRGSKTALQFIGNGKNYIKFKEY
ncbi:MAG: transglutaminase-like domain-containing protein [Oscillospiraceae bacterium]|nr:transglutaminase-like domain-containing protein [Oscillospiraceae bacterium]